MSFTTWVSDPSLDVQNLTLCTKSKSYEFGRRLYHFQIGEQQYWLKYHQANIHERLAQSFQHELNFYREQALSLHELVLPHAIVQLNQLPQLNVKQGEGLILMDADAFFTPIQAEYDLVLIHQQILVALEALERLHQHGWIHGDLKTDHFRYYQNSCRLMDFEQCDTLRPQHTKIHATPHYMAPELFHGQSKSVQSDLYAFGIIVYEWLTQSKLKARTYRDWAMLHCQQLEIELAQQVKCFLPVLEGLLQKQIEQRFSDAETAKKALNSLKLL